MCERTTHEYRERGGVTLTRLANWGGERYGVVQADIAPWRYCVRCGCSEAMIEHMGWTNCEGGDDA